MDEFIFLTEKTYPWADMFIEILKNNGIPYTYEMIREGAMASRTYNTGVYKIYVPKEYKEKAEEILAEYFESNNE